MKTLTNVFLINGLIAILLVSIFASFSLRQFYAAEAREERENLEKCMRTFQELLRQKGEGFRAVDGKLLVGSYVTNGNFEVPDKVQDIFGGTATIFMGDTRVSTNVRDNKGNRAVGTRLQGTAYDAVFRAGRPYRGEALILGEPYVTAYDPIRDKSGKVIGALFVGVEKSASLSRFSALKTELIITLAALLAIFAVPMVLLARLANNFEKAKSAHLTFLQTLIDTIPCPVYYKDATGCYLGCNRAFESGPGVPREKLIGKKAHDIWTKEQADLFHQKDLALLKNTGGQTYVASITYADGTLHDIEFHKATFYGTDGALGGLVGVMLDITERKAAEEEIINANQLLFDIVQFLPDATFVVDRESRVIAWNRAIETMTGVKREEMLGKGDYEYAVPFYGLRRPLLVDLLDKEQGAFPEDYHSLQRSGRTLSVEASIPTFGEGTGRYFWSTASPLFDKNGNQIGGIQSVRDITERRRAEEEKSRLEAQLQSSRAIAGMMMQLGHDLKTPLTPLFVLLPLMKELVHDPELEKMVEICHANARHIHLLSDKARKLAGLSSTFALDQFEKIPLAGSLDTYLQDEKDARNDVLIENSIDDGIVVHGIPDQIRELFSNLISNAVRHSPAGGVVRVAADQNEDTVVVSVRDQGTGLSPEHLDRIFDEFFKVDESRHDLSMTGLGLTICKRIVLNHKGRIWADSPGPGKGTTVLFTIPRIAA